MKNFILKVFVAFYTFCIYSCTKKSISSLMAEDEVHTSTSTAKYEPNSAADHLLKRYNEFYENEKNPLKVERFLSEDRRKATTEEAKNCVKNGATTLNAFSHFNALERLENKLLESSGKSPMREFYHSSFEAYFLSKLVPLMSKNGNKLYLPCEETKSYESISALYTGERIRKCHGDQGFRHCLLPVSRLSMDHGESAGGVYFAGHQEGSTHVGLAVFIDLMIGGNFPKLSEFSGELALLVNKALENRLKYIADKVKDFLVKRRFSPESVRSAISELGLLAKDCKDTIKEKLDEKGFAKILGDTGIVDSLTKEESSEEVQFSFADFLKVKKFVYDLDLKETKDFIRGNTDCNTYYDEIVALIDWLLRLRTESPFEGGITVVKFEKRLLEGCLYETQASGVRPCPVKDFEKIDSEGCSKQYRIFISDKLYKEESQGFEIKHFPMFNKCTGSKRAFENFLNLLNEFETDIMPNLRKKIS